MGDATSHCGGLGQLSEGSPNVVVGGPVVVFEAAAASTTSRVINLRRLTEPLLEVLGEALPQEVVEALNDALEVVELLELLPQLIDVIEAIAHGGAIAESLHTLLSSSGQLLAAALTEHASEWFDYADDDWWGESMLSSAGAGALTGLVAGTIAGGDSYGRSSALWGAVAGGLAGGLGSVTTGLIGGEDGWAIVGQAFAGVAVGAVAAVAVYVATNEGPRDLDAYPDEALYQLPYAGTAMCVQGNHGVISHFGVAEFAYDFGLARGTPVLCARAGTVVQVRNCYDGNAVNGNERANTVVVGHHDGSFGIYVHHEQWGARVHIGLQVEVGQVLSLAGNTGRSLGDHVHFAVTATHDLDHRSQTVPVRFLDPSTAGDAQVPRTFGRYASTNRDRGVHPDYVHGTAGEDLASHQDRYSSVRPRSPSVHTCNPPLSAHFPGTEAT